MKIDKEVPFYKNPDDTHCYQASLKMVMKYFWPDKDFFWEELDRITAKVKGLWTWTMAGLIWLQDHGIEVRDVEVFDYEKFIKFGGKYLIDKYGEEVGESQIEHSDIEQERKIAKDFIKKIPIEKRIPTMNDLKNFLSQGYLIICIVNSRKLNNEPGYSGHFVVLKGFDDEYFFIHDPSFPTSPHRLVKFSFFENAWAYPNDEAKTMVALKLKNKMT
ncbi:MAG: peptidase C39 family protein [Candidatus Nealsonbacteria bacterium]|nr:peptidase C39 family protein [Candidatus Nealsonbacteria bacterium]